MQAAVIVKKKFILHMAASIQKCILQISSFMAQFDADF